MSNQIIGWTATAVFVGSYFFARPSALRAMQMLGSVLWIFYGIMINAMPVIVANVLVFSAAAWTFFARKPARGIEGSSRVAVPATAPGD